MYNSCALRTACLFVVSKFKFDHIHKFHSNKLNSLVLIVIDRTELVLDKGSQTT